MAIKNKYDYRGGVLEALNVEHTPSDLRNEDEYRKKVLEGFGVEYTDDDINQMSLFREKVVEGLASGSGGGGGGETWNTVFEGSVTTVADDPAPIGTIENLSLNADIIKVTFNGTEYECNKNANESYGAPFDESTEEFDWSEYPFNLSPLIVDKPRVDLYTETAGTYTLKIEEPQSGGSSDFSTANAVFHVEFIGYTGISAQPTLVTVAYVENNTLMSGCDNDNPLTTANNPEIVTYKGVGRATLWIMQENADVAYEITQGNAVVTINEYGGYEIEFTDDFEMNLTITKNT